MITFSCPQCGTTLRVAEDKAGGEGNCPKCKNPVVFPAGPPPPSIPPQPPSATKSAGMSSITEAARYSAPPARMVDRRRRRQIVFGWSDKTNCPKCGGDARRAGRRLNVVAGLMLVLMSIATPTIIAVNRGGRVHVVILALAAFQLGIGIYGLALMPGKFRCMKCRSKFQFVRHPGRTRRTAVQPPTVSRAEAVHRTGASPPSAARPPSQRRWTIPKRRNTGPLIFGIMLGVAVLAMAIALAVRRWHDPSLPSESGGDSGRIEGGVSRASGEDPHDHPPVEEPGPLELPRPAHRPSPREPDSPVREPAAPKPQPPVPSRTRRANCSKCGKRVAEDASFCTECGAGLVGKTQAGHTPALKTGPVGAVTFFKAYAAGRADRYKGCLVRLGGAVTESSETQGKGGHACVLVCGRRPDGTFYRITKAGEGKYNTDFSVDRVFGVQLVWTVGGIQGYRSRGTALFDMRKLCDRWQIRGRFHGKYTEVTVTQSNQPGHKERIPVLVWEAVGPPA